MKITQFLKYASVIAIATFTFSCGSDDATPQDTAPQITALSPATGSVGALITVTGSNLTAPDSVKLGKSKLTIAGNTGTTFTFNVPNSAFSGKLYFYKGAKVDSSKSFTVTEPNGFVSQSKITGFINGKEFSSSPDAQNDTINGNPVFVVVALIGTESVILTLPNRLASNQTVPASAANLFLYSPDLSSSSPIIFTANGLNGTSGAFVVNEVGPNGTYLRGTFNFTAQSVGGTKVNITNGRLALRLN